MSEVAMEVRERERQLRDETVRVLQTPPDRRDVARLLEFFGNDWVRSGVTEYYMKDLSNSYGGPREALTLVGQRIEELPDGRIRVRSCEEAFLDAVYVDGSTGMTGVVVRRGPVRVWERQGDGVLRIVEEGDDKSFCANFLER